MTLPNDASERERRAPPSRTKRTSAEREAAAFVASESERTEGIGLYRLLVESVRDYAIFALDPEGNIMSWNKGAQRLKGYAPHEIIGRHFSAFYPPADIAAGKPAWELEEAIRDGRVEDEDWRLRKDGTRFWANVVITALRKRSGELVGFAKVTRDLTERRAAQQRALLDARLIAEAEAASRTKSEFLASMSHELRTPINATLGYAELLDAEIGGPLTEQQRSYMTRIRSSQQHLLRIVTDLLDYSRLDAGSTRYDLEQVSLNDVIDTVLAMVEPQAMAKEVEIQRDPCEETLVALADRTRAQQIALNLLANAVKYTPSGGRVAVRCARAGDKVALVVADTGPGVEPDQQSAIFEPFVQVGRTLTSGHEGTGLGLSISRVLARAMGGDVTIDSVPGEGATFTLTLPAVPER